MGTFQSFRKAYGALKDSTKVGLAKVNSEYKDLDITIVKATNHVECPPKERYVRKFFYATSIDRPRPDVAHCIHALSRRLLKTRDWIVAIKILILIHRTLREGDSSFREELLSHSRRGHIFQMSNFKDDSTTLAWDCSAWVRTYALFLEERIECFRILKYDIETERVPTRVVNVEKLLEQLPAMQQLVYRLIACQPEGAAYHNYLVQYALALVLKESFKIFCAINDGIINLVDLFFDMSRHDAVKALNIYKRAGQQSENLGGLYEYCKGLEIARYFQFPILRQPPPSFVAAMEEYIREAPQSGSVLMRLEYRETNQQQHVEIERKDDGKHDDIDNNPNPLVVTTEEEAEPQSNEVEVGVQVEAPPLVSTEEDTEDLLGLNEVVDSKAAEQLEQSNALALAILSPSENNNALVSSSNCGGAEWELALVSTPSNSNNFASPLAVDQELGGGFNKLLLDSLYEDENARKQIQLNNAGGYGQLVQNPFEQNDPFLVSSNIAPPSDVQMAIMAQQQQQQQIMMQQQQHTMSPFQYPTQYHHQQQMDYCNPFLEIPKSISTTPQQGNHPMLL